jgi:hypothetical protein
MQIDIEIEFLKKQESKIKDKIDRMNRKKFPDYEVNQEKYRLDEVLKNKVKKEVLQAKLKTKL